MHIHTLRIYTKIVGMELENLPLGYLAENKMDICIPVCHELIIINAPKNLIILCGSQITKRDYLEP